MKVNSNTKIFGKGVILVPYKIQHVPKYHNWMKSEELQLLTASEPLTIEQEYEMQKSWCEDEDKCTFIVLNKTWYDKNEDEIESMIGDTNVFLSNDGSNRIGEIEIMIAEKEARGKKLGWETVILMLIYGIVYLKIEIFYAKIALHNEISIKMFTKLGFVEKSKSNIFKEITLEKNVNDDWLKWLRQQTEFYIVENSN